MNIKINGLEESKKYFNLDEPNIIEGASSIIYAYGKYLKPILAAFLINKRREQESAFESEEIYHDVITWMNNDPSEEELNEILNELLECSQLDQESSVNTKVKDIKTQIQQALEQQDPSQETIQSVYNLSFYDEIDEEDDDTVIISSTTNISETETDFHDEEV